MHTYLMLSAHKEVWFEIVQSNVYITVWGERIGLYVLLNKEADRTVLHQPLYKKMSMRLIALLLDLQISVLQHAGLLRLMNHDPVLYQL